MNAFPKYFLVKQREKISTEVRAFVTESNRLNRVNRVKNQVGYNLTQTPNHHTDTLLLMGFNNFKIQ